MNIFSSRIDVPAGEPLGGYKLDRLSTSGSSALEVNGVVFTAIDGNQYRLCSVDALYAGRLCDEFSEDKYSTIFAASHTHYAPMLDDSKPHLGRFSQGGFDAYVRALRQTELVQVSPTQCRLYRSEVSVPVYRRFDYPDRWWNRFLTRHFGLYPNDAKTIDRTIYLFEFADRQSAQFVVVYHACHPVTHGGACELSPDYVGEIRNAIRKKFAVETVIFLQGCAGDVRPNLTQKRVKWLPKFRLNWKFSRYPSAQEIAHVNEQYKHAILTAEKYRDIALTEDGFDVSTQQAFMVDGQNVEIISVNLPDRVEFLFLPFEVSHLYHLEKFSSENGMKFIVSCVNKTRGYLSHPLQHRAGGYEVYGSLHCMGLKEKLEIERLV